MTSQISKLNSLTTDQERLDFLKDNPNFILYLDNDSAFIGISNSLNISEEERESLEELIEWDNSHFNKDFGNREGIILLLDNLNIKASFV